MIYLLETALSPIIGIMELGLEFYNGIVGLTGISILLLSFTFSILLLPMQKYGRKVEQRIDEKIKAVNLEVQALKETLKGEKLFLATEKIYRKHGYHPIQNVALGTSFFVMLPVLISALFLFTDEGVLAEVNFLFIKDLSKPDALLGPVNVLPLVMTAVTLVDARVRFKNDKSSQYRFLFIATVLLVLVYNLSAGLVLYWIGNNVVSMLLSCLKRRTRRANPTKSVHL